MPEHQLSFVLGKTRHDELMAEFSIYHTEHPEVWFMFRKFAFNLIRRGFKNGAAKAIIERIRWETDTPDDYGNSTFKINNNYAPFYSRLFMDTFPQYEGFFRLRHQTTKDEEPTGLPPLGPDDFPYLAHRGKE